MIGIPQITVTFGRSPLLHPIPPTQTRPGVVDGIQQPVITARPVSIKITWPECGLREIMGACCAMYVRGAGRGGAVGCPTHDQHVSQAPKADHSGDVINNLSNVFMKIWLKILSL